MNIFVSSPDPENCATYLCDKRLVKMVLETAQLLSTAINEHGGSGPYKTMHINHPCSLWARATNNNYQWLVEHFKALCSEYTKRFKKIHKCQQHLSCFVNSVILIPAGPLTQFPNCTIYKKHKDVHAAYKEYLDYKWQKDKYPPKWCGLTKEQIKELNL